MSGTRRTPRGSTGAGALRAVELVRRRATADRRRACARRPASCRPSARRRCGTSAPRAWASVGNRRDRLDRADLVVGVHHRDERGVVGERRRARRSGETIPERSTGDERDAPAALGERLHGVQHRLVLDAAGDQVAAAGGSSASAAPRMATLSLSVPPPVKTISAASAPISVGHRRPGLVDDGLGLLAEMVDAGGVAPDLAQVTRVIRSTTGRGRAGWWRYGPDRCAWRGPAIVAFLLTLSNKRTRQRFGRGSYTGETSARSPTSPGLLMLIDTLDVPISRRGGGFNDVEA